MYYYTAQYRADNSSVHTEMRQI